MILVYTTHKNNADAIKTVKHLLNKKLIACGNIIASNSIYNWKGKTVTAKETITIMKTRDSLWSSVHDEILAIHPYEVPAVIKIAAEESHEFSVWLNQETLNPLTGGEDKAPKAKAKTKAKQKARKKK